jgi:hypothetical protein
MLERINRINDINALVGQRYFIRRSLNEFDLVAVIFAGNFERVRINLRADCPKV